MYNLLALEPHVHLSVCIWAVELYNDSAGGFREESSDSTTLTKEKAKSRNDARVLVIKPYVHQMPSRPTVRAIPKSCIN